jgi:hypothetical protein
MDFAGERSGKTPGKKKFTNQEDDIIIAKVSEYGSNAWNAIASHLRNRSAKQCRERWKHCLQPGIDNSSWTRTEDPIIQEKSHSIGAKWCAIREFLPGRTDVAIKNRWAMLSKHPPGPLRRSIEPVYQSPIDHQPIAACALLAVDAKASGQNATGGARTGVLTQT